MKLRVLLLCVLCIGGTGWAAETDSGATNVVRQAPPAAPGGLDVFMVEPGFRVELAAAAPMLSAPVAMAFDESGRLYVVEMRDYPDRGASTPHQGRVRLLESPNEEGVYQTSTVFADDLPLPSAIACYGGGVFVAAAPDVLYLKAGRSGGAEIKKIVLTGFGGDAPPTANHLPNNFNWGPDDRIHGASAGIGGVITAPGWGGGQASIEGGDFSFNPRTLTVQPEAGPAESGLTFDDFGREYVSDRDHPLRSVMYDLRYTMRNPFYAAPPALREALSPATEVFRFDAAAAAVPARSSWLKRRNRLAPGIVSAWLAQARGGVIYRGQIFGTNYVGNAFVADPEHHLIHRAVLSDTGYGAVGRRATNELNSEFLISKDDSFQPAQIVNGPDGALYVADFQGGGERGRILRIVPEKWQRPKPPQLRSLSTTELVSVLGNPNGWQRDTAARLLFEREDSRSAVPLLAQMAAKARLPVLRVQALRALAEADGYWETNALGALSDRDPRVREAGAQLCERLIVNGQVSNALWEALRRLATDADSRVRLQAAFTIGGIRRPDKVPILVQILGRDLRNPYLQNALLSALPDSGAAMLAYVGASVSLRNDPAGEQFMRQLALMIGLQGMMPDVTGTMNYLLHSPLTWGQRFAVLAELGEGLHRTHSSFMLVDPQGVYQGLYSAALGIANGGWGPDALRIDAIRLLGTIPYSFDQAGDWLLLQCSPQPFPAVQAAVLGTLGRFDDPRVLPALLANWPAMAPAVRQQAVTALLLRLDRWSGVLDAVKSGRIAPDDVSSVSRNLLRTCRDPDISRRAAELFGAVLRQRTEVVQRFQAALRLRASADHGRQIYLGRCAACHQPDATGAALGPILAGARTQGREKLLGVILEPNANVPLQYQPCVVETKAGEILVGIKTAENPATITIRTLDGPAVWPRLNIQSMQMQASWSLMPERLEQGLSTQDLADLLEALMTGNLGG